MLVRQQLLVNPRSLLSRRQTGLEVSGHGGDAGHLGHILGKTMIYYLTDEEDLFLINEFGPFCPSCCNWLHPGINSNWESVSNIGKTTRTDHDFSVQFFSNELH